VSSFLLRVGSRSFESAHVVERGGWEFVTGVGGLAAVRAFGGSGEEGRFGERGEKIRGIAF